MLIKDTFFIAPFLSNRKCHSSCLESLYLLNLYNELSAAVQRRVGELRLMTLGNQGSSQLQMGGNRKRAPPSPKRDEVPSLDWEGPHQLGEELPITNTALFIIKNITNHHPTVDPFWSWEGPHQLPLQFLL